jgi:hypothetical protein
MRYRDLEHLSLSRRVAKSLKKFGWALDRYFRKSPKGDDEGPFPKGGPFDPMNPNYK